MPKDVIRSPWDGRFVGSAAEGDWSDLDAALDAAQTAFREWRYRPLPERQRLLQQIADRIDANREDLAELLHWEVGKPVAMAEAEIRRTAITFRVAADAAEHLEISVPQNPWDDRWTHREADIRWVPRGVVLGFVPYNWPFNLLAHKLAPALACGCTVVVKVSPLAPISSMTLCRIVHESGAPDGTVNAWNGSNRDAQRAVTDHRTNVLSFTGSAAVGWKLHALRPAEPAVLEHGGDAFSIVWPGAEIAQSAEKVAASAFGFAGQVCISTQHVLVHPSLAGEFEAALVAEAMKPAPYDAPLVSEIHAERVEAMVQQAVDLGAKVLCGGRRMGNRYEKTVLTEVPPTADIYREEVFGPVCTLERVPDFNGVISRINQSPHGIQLGLFGGSAVLVDRLIVETKVPGANWNEPPSVRFDHLPYGGEGRSGLGREGPLFAMQSMCIPKVQVR